MPSRARQHAAPGRTNALPPRDSDHECPFWRLLSAAAVATGTGRTDRVNLAEVDLERPLPTL